MYSERTLFPMLGVGTFNIMFWVGFVVGHNLGLACGGMMLSALLFGALGSYAVVKLERLSCGARRRSTQEAKSGASDVLLPPRSEVSARRTVRVGA